MKRVVPALLVAVVALTACGIPSDDKARRINPDEIPPGIVEAATPSTPPTVAESEGTKEVVAIYLIRGGALSASLAEVEGPATLSEVLELITTAPSTELARQGYRSALVSDLPVVQSVSLARGVADIDLGPAFTELPSNDTVLALGQLVLTATARPGVGQVRFTLDGVPVQVPTADGTITTDPLSRDDYIGLLPNVTTPTS